MLLVSGALPAAIFYDHRCMGGCSHLCSAVRHPQIQPPACGLRRRRGALRARCSATCASPACAPTAVSALGEEGVCYCWGGRWWWLLGRTAAAAAPHGFGGGCCWLLWALCFLGEKEGAGGVSQKARGSKGRAREGLRAKCAMIVDPFAHLCTGTRLCTRYLPCFTYDPTEESGTIAQEMLRWLEMSSLTCFRAA
jgi:hypothetical protein